MIYYTAAVCYRRTINFVSFYKNISIVQEFIVSCAKQLKNLNKNDFLLTVDTFLCVCEFLNSHKRCFFLGGG